MEKHRRPQMKLKVTINHTNFFVVHLRVWWCGVERDIQRNGATPSGLTLFFFFFFIKDKVEITVGRLSALAAESLGAQFSPEWAFVLCRDASVEMRNRSLSNEKHPDQVNMTSREYLWKWSGSWQRQTGLFASCLKWKILCQALVRFSGGICTLSL